MNLGVTQIVISSLTDIYLTICIVNLNIKKAKRSSGGIVLLYKENLKNGIHVIKNHYDTLIWLKLDHSFFNTSEDIYLCGSYIWGDDSPIYNIFNVDLFDILENDICLYETLGCVFICGDFNSRVGDKKDYIVCDKFNSCIDSHDYTSDCIPDRASIVTESNCSIFVKAHRFEL